MKILVGDLAKLYGISSQTLHYYEEKNILVPKRDVINGYRYYEPADLSKLGSIKKYRNAGFSLEDALFAMEEASKWDIVSKYNEQKSKLKRKIEDLGAILSQLDEDLSLYMRFQEIGTTILVEELEGFLRFESMGTKIVFQDEQTRKEAIPWFKNVLHTCASEMFYLDEEDKISYFTYGMLATRSVAKFLNLKLSKNVSEIEEGRFVTSIISAPYSLEIEEAIYSCIAFIEDNNLQIRGNPFTKTVLVHNDDDNPKVKSLLSQIIVPIK